MIKITIPGRLVMMDLNDPDIIDQSRLVDKLHNELMRAEREVV